MSSHDDQPPTIAIRASIIADTSPVYAEILAVIDGRLPMISAAAAVTIASWCLVGDRVPAQLAAFVAGRPARIDGLLAELDALGADELLAPDHLNPPAHLRAFITAGSSK